MIDPKYLTSEYSSDEEIALAEKGLCIWQTEYGCRMGYIGYCKEPVDSRSRYGYCREHDDEANGF